MNKEKFIKALTDSIEEVNQIISTGNEDTIDTIMLMTVVVCQRELLKLVEGGVFDNE